MECGDRVDGVLNLSASLKRSVSALNPEGRVEQHNRCLAERRAHVRKLIVFMHAQQSHELVAATVQIAMEIHAILAAASHALQYLTIKVQAPPSPQLQRAGFWCAAQPDCWLGTVGAEPSRGFGKKLKCRSWVLHFCVLMQLFQLQPSS